MAGAHAPRTGSSRRGLLVVGTGIAVAALAAVIIVGVTRTTASSSTTTTAPPPTLAVLQSTPANAATVNTDAAIRISLSAPLASNSPMPTISPAVPGSWQHLSATTLEYVQNQPLSPGQSVTVTIPGGSGGLTSDQGAHLASTVSSTFQVAPMSTLRVQQLLAELGYLPLSFTPTTPSSTTQVSAEPEQGTFAWRWSTLPSQLTSQWSEGDDNVITRGAIMEFENNNGLTTDGEAGPQVWTKLIAARQADAADPDPYTYVLVSKSLPESLSLYSNGQVIYTTAVNTGIPKAPTADGTFPVYERFTSTTMKGTNPDGTKYNDPNIPWVSYFNGGDALHGYIRASYGFPQSLGCVEMPYANAGIVWPHTPIGTLVTVN